MWSGSNTKLPVLNTLPKMPTEETRFGMFRVSPSSSGRSGRLFASGAIWSTTRPVGRTWRSRESSRALAAAVAFCEASSSLDVTRWLAWFFDMSVSRSRSARS